MEVEEEHGELLSPWKCQTSFSQAFSDGKGQLQEIFRKAADGDYAVFNYDPASDKFTADAKSPSDCGYACHTTVKAKDYIFHPYQKR